MVLKIIFEIRKKNKNPEKYLNFGKILWEIRENTPGKKLRNLEKYSNSEKYSANSGKTGKTKNKRSSLNFRGKKSEKYSKFGKILNKMWGKNCEILKIHKNRKKYW